MPSNSLEFASQIFGDGKRYMADASALIMHYFEEGFKTRSKDDSTLVTEADQAVEVLLRNAISADYPTHSIVGEEQEAKRSTSSFTWVIDPIDGTQSFVHGVPTFGCMLGVFDGETPIAGFIYHPALGENYAAAAGLGCFRNGTRMNIENSTEIDRNDIITLCTRAQWDLTDVRPCFDYLWQQHKYCRIYYDCFSLTRAIAGQSAAAIEVNVSWWDIAPVQVMIEEAGGRYVNLGKRIHPSGKELYSALFGKSGATKQIEGWLATSGWK